MGCPKQNILLFVSFTISAAIKLWRNINIKHFAEMQGAFYIKVINQDIAIVTT